MSAPNVNPNGYCGVVTDCCDVPVGTTLHAEIENRKDGCACLGSGPIPLHYDAANDWWFGEKGGIGCMDVPGSSDRIKLVLRCNDGQWQLLSDRCAVSGEFPTGWQGGNLWSVECEPLALVFQFFNECLSGPTQFSPGNAPDVDTAVAELCSLITRLPVGGDIAGNCPHT